MSKFIVPNDTEFCSCYTHPFAADVSGEIYCRVANQSIAEEELICKDCPLMMYDAEHKCYFGCYYFDTERSEAQTDAERIQIAIEEERLPLFPYFEEEDRHQVEHALQFAANAHAGVCRKGNKLPYILHVVETAGIVHKMTDEANIISAAALHDVLEDTDVTEEELRKEFGEDVLELVRYQTEDKRRERPASETWKERKEEALHHYAGAPIRAKQIALADKVSNMRASKRDYEKLGIDMWSKFNEKDPKQQAWYYRSLLEVLAELRDTEPYQEYQSLVRFIFGE
mgnify:CR=1 FL=1